MSLPVSYGINSQKYSECFLAAESSSFFQHSGISIKGIGRALTEAVSKDKPRQAGQRLPTGCQNYFILQALPLIVKLTELFRLAGRSWRKAIQSKTSLTLYVKQIYLGQRCVWDQAAAKQYYSKSFKRLTIAEMAMIAGLPKKRSSNTILLPAHRRALERRNWILGQMLKNGAISRRNTTKRLPHPMDCAYTKRNLIKAPYLAEMTRASLVEKWRSCHQFGLARKAYH